MRRSVLIAMILTSLAAACQEEERPPPVGNLIGRVTFATGGGEARTSFLQVADSGEERARGLMDVEHLDADSGMVFVFDEEQDGSFWMKDTLIPLSIAFWGDDGRVLDILEMEPCTDSPCPMYSSRRPYRYALEMNAQWFEERGVEIGDRVELTIGSE